MLCGDLSIWVVGPSSSQLKKANSELVAEVKELTETIEEHEATIKTLEEEAAEQVRAAPVLCSRRYLEHFPHSSYCRRRNRVKPPQPPSCRQ